MNLLQVLPLAHALVARQDLPIPAWLFAWGASIVLIVSFFALSAAWREPASRTNTGAPLGGGVSRALLGLPAQILCGALGVFLLGVAVYAGLKGTEAPDRNFAVTFVFVTCLARLPGRSASSSATSSSPSTRGGRSAAPSAARSGDRRAALRPPRLPGAARPLAGRGRPGRLRLAGDRLRGQRRRRGRRLAAHARGRRPRLQRLHAGDDGLFGVEEWCERGEIFSVYFGMFSRLGFLEVRDGRLGVRRPLSAATSWATRARLGRRRDRLDRRRPASTAPRRAPSRARSKHLQMARSTAGSEPTAALRAHRHALPRARVLGVGLVYLVGVHGMRTRQGAPPLAQAAAPASPTR